MMRSSVGAAVVLSLAFWAGAAAYATTPTEQNPSAQQATGKDAAQGKPASAKQNKTQDSKKASHPSETDQNPFPKAVSQRAAQARQQAQPPDTPSPAPQAKSSEASSSSDANPFPQAQSERAAQAAHGKQAPQPQYSSSQSSSLVGGSSEPASSSAPPVRDPARAKKDVQVGDYYMGSGDYRGAYLRFKDAVKYDQGNLSAIFGLAQSARKVGKYDEAARNYRIYLAVVPKGSKAKTAEKALRQMAGK